MYARAHAPEVLRRKRVATCVSARARSGRAGRRLRIRAANRANREHGATTTLPVVATPHGDVPAAPYGASPDRLRIIGAERPTEAERAGRRPMRAVRLGRQPQACRVTPSTMIHPRTSSLAREPHRSVAVCCATCARQPLARSVRGRELVDVEALQLPRVPWRAVAFPDGRPPPSLRPGRRRGHRSSATPRALPRSATAGAAP